MNDEKKSWVERAIDRGKRHPYVGLVVLVGVGVIGLGHITGALETIFSFVEDRIVRRSDLDTPVGARTPSEELQPRLSEIPPVQQADGPKRFLADGVTADVLHQAYGSDERVETLYVDHWIPPPGWSGAVSGRAKQEPISGRWFVGFRQGDDATSVIIHVWAGQEIAQLVKGDRITVTGRIKDIRTLIVVVDQATVVRDP